MINDTHNRALAETSIAQLNKSERGRSTLAALSVFLHADATWSLDAHNQRAVALLLVCAFETPSVREMLL